MGDLMLKGIDVSSHQGQINWNKVKAAGIQFAMIRAGYGNNNIDKQFKRNMEECNRLGIPVGVYWFSYALNEKMAAEEADHVLKAIKPYKVEYPVVFDLEYDTIKYASRNGVTIGKVLASRMVDAFCSRIEQAGYYAMNYANLDYLKNMFNSELRSRYDLWYAQYSDYVNRSVGLVGMWQYTSSGKVDGIIGNVDMNYDYRDYKAIIEKAGLNKSTRRVTVAIETSQTNVELLEALASAGFKASEV